MLTYSGSVAKGKITKNRLKQGLLPSSRNKIVLCVSHVLGAAVVRGPLLSHDSQINVTWTVTSHKMQISSIKVEKCGG